MMRNRGGTRDAEIYEKTCILVHISNVNDCIYWHCQVFLGEFQLHFTCLFHSYHLYKFMYIIYWISLILVFIPSFYILGYLVCVIIASLNLYICYSILSKIYENLCNVVTTILVPDLMASANCLESLSIFSNGLPTVI